MHFEETSDDDIWIRLWASGRVSRGTLSSLRAAACDRNRLESRFDGPCTGSGLSLSELEDAAVSGEKVIETCRRRFGSLVRFGLYLGDSNVFRPVSWVGALPANPVLAVVGTRNVSSVDGRRIYEWMRRHLTDVNGILSGGAKGVDTLAHEVSFELSRPTWIVFAGGLLNPTPRSGHGMFERVLEQGGGWITEKPPSMSPRDYDFIERNKLIASIAGAVLVARAPSRSGALSTARSAMKMGKPVAYLAWDFDDVGAEGSVFLASKGCKAVYTRPCLMSMSRSLFRQESPELPFDAPACEVPREPKAEFTLPESVHEAWSAFLQWNSGDVNQMGNSPSAHAEYLLDLELAGVLRALPGGECALTELGLQMRNARL